jgi:hypothetical protein
MTLEAVKDHIRVSSFLPDAKRHRQAAEIVWNALTLFRENKTRKYVSHTGKLIKKPSPTHNVPIGRYDQAEIRTVLISAICRAWIVGTSHKPTLNRKRDPDSAFMAFASYILACEGIGHIHPHLEEYWSRRKAELLKNNLEAEKWRLSGGSWSD